MDNIPIIFSDEIPEGMMFMLPPDVTNAMDTALQISESAFCAATMCWLGPILFGHFWLSIADELQRIAEQKARAFEFAMASAESVIAIAAQQKRIGCIKDIAIGS